MKNLGYLTKIDIENIGGRIAFDEDFKKILGQPGFFISNYGRVVSKRQSKAKLIKSGYYHGYERFSTQRTKNGRSKRYDFRVHALVAAAFVEIPQWINEEDYSNLQVHHYRKVSREVRVYGLNTANNLTYLPEAVHKFLHKHEYVEIFISDCYKKYGFLDACKKLKITPYDLMYVMKTQPVKEEADYIYYSADVNRDNGSKITVQIRFKG